MRPLIHLHILASGSKGNAAVVEGPGGLVLVDCGLSRKRLYERAAELGVSLDDLVAAVFTHEHSDHVSGVPVFAKRFGGPLYASRGTVAARQSLAGLAFTSVRTGSSFEVAGMRVQTFATSHDVADPFGLRFSVEDGDGDVLDALGWCTDTGYLTDEALDVLRGCRVLGIESNHDPRMLATGPYPTYLKARVGGKRGHLSNAQCAEALPALVTQETEAVVALHLSEKNNTPSTCMRTLAEALGATAANTTFTEATANDGRLTLRVAAQDRPLSVW